MLLRPTLLFVAISCSGCAIQQGNTTSQEPLAIPQPPAHLPKPYTGAAILPQTTVEKEYANYLWSTAMLPDQALCDQNLTKQMQSEATSGSVMREWVTRPFLAWGGIWKKSAVVGPVQHLYSITEAHLTWRDQQDQERKSTYSCYVQYALQKEVSVWRSGHLKYSSYTAEGHNKYQAGLATAPFAAAPPDTASAWEPGIRYYKVEE